MKTRTEIDTRDEQRYPSTARLTAGLASCVAVLTIAAGGLGAATFTVVNVNDFGEGTLRQAIANANNTAGPDLIHFDIPGSGPYTIRIFSQLPVITDSVTIDGTTQPGYAEKPIIEISGINAGPNVSGLGFIASGCTVRGLVINHLTFGNGIELYGGGNHVLQGNYIGTDQTGTQAAPNDWAGILVFNGSAGNLIGGPRPEDANVIANNRRSGIALVDSASRNVVQGNFIGTDFTGTNPMGNGFHGVEIDNSNLNTVGGPGMNVGNVIAFNGGAGVWVASGLNNTILGNSIHANIGLGIELGADGPNPNDANDTDTGANAGQNYPLISSVTTNVDGMMTINGALRSLRNRAFTLEYFVSAECDSLEFGEGRLWLGRTNITTDAAGYYGFALEFPVAHGFITATATDSSAGNTSEFCPCVQAGGELPITADLGTTLNATNLTWTSGGRAWLGQSAVTHDGVAAAQSGTLGDFGESWVQATVTGPGTLAFWWKVSSEMDFDVLEFSIDGTVRRRLSGEEDWEQPSLAIPAGNHTLRWRYAKDESIGLGLDRAWLDQVSFMLEAGPLVVLAQPVSQTVGPQDTVSFVAAVAGETPRTYQWFHDLDPIAGATNPSLTLPNVGLAQSGGYHVVASNSFGSVTSSVAGLSLTINRAVQSVLLLVDPTFPSPYRAALDNLGRSYEAFSDNRAFNTAVAGADAATTLVVVDVSDANAVLNPVTHFVNAGGRAIVQYWALNTNSALAAACNATVVPPLLTFPQPVYDWGSSTLLSGTSSPLGFVDMLGHDGEMLHPVAGGRAIAGYSSVPTANQAALIIGRAGRTILNGFMLVELTSNEAATLAQNQLEALLTEAERPTITAQPLSQAVRPGANVTNSVAAVSIHGPLTYQWRHNETDIAGASNATLIITNVQLTNEGAYSVEVSDSLGSVTSSNSLLNVLVNLTVVQPVQSQSVVLGGDVTFSVAVAGNPAPFGYEWRKVSPASSLASNVSLQHFDFFALTNVQASQAGTYRVQIRNLANPGGAQSSFTLSVQPDSDGDGLPDAWEQTYPTAADPAPDTDRDGLTNLEEYRAGTDPTNPSSVLKIERITVGSAVNLEFPAIATKTYSVQYRDSLHEHQWSNLADVLGGLDRAALVTDPASTRQRYYRLVTPRQP